MIEKKVKYKLGGADVVWAETLFIPDSVISELEVIVDNDDVLPIKIRFITETTEDGKHSSLMRGTGSTVAGAECNTVIELKPEHHAALPWNFA